jgi:hypothetical protein
VVAAAGPPLSTAPLLATVDEVLASADDDDRWLDLFDVDPL